ALNGRSRLPTLSGAPRSRRFTVRKSRACFERGFGGESNAMFDRLTAYLDSVRARDPAPRSRWEILLYPGVWALGMHRAAHWLFEAELYFLARLVNHFSRWITAIDIHPGAKIGRHF